MKEIKFPLLKPNQIEVRVGQVSKKGYTLLLYKTSRTDAEILDQVVGIGNWQKKFYTLQGVGIGDTMRSVVVCSVGIYDDDKHEWVWKDDSGTESQFEQDKGICSDAFKRASGGSCWGIGRELYYIGFIFIKATTTPKSNGKGYELTEEDKYRRFAVKEIVWKENPIELVKLVIEDEDTNEVVYSYPKSTKVSTSGEKVAKNPIPNNDTQVSKPNNVFEEDKKTVREYLDTLPADKWEQFTKYLKTHFGKGSIGELNESEMHTLALSTRR